MFRLQLLLLPAILTACAVVKGDGQATSEPRELSSFDAVSNATMVPVSVEVGQEQSVEVLCDDNLIEYILTDVEGQTLKIHITNGVLAQPVADCEVLITAPELRELESSGSGGLEAWGVLSGLARVHSSGSGRVDVRDIHTDAIEAQNSGSGGITLAGVAGFASLDNSGSGGINGQALVCEGAELDNSGSGSISLTVNGDVELHLSGSGNVELFGEPVVGEQSDSGSGDVVIH